MSLEDFVNSFEGKAVELLITPASTEEALRHAASYFGVAKEHAKAMDALALATEQRRRTRAELIEPIRKLLIADGQRPTDATMDDAIQKHPAHTDARNREIAAATHEALWKALREAHAQRAAHLDTMYGKESPNK